MGIKVGGGAGGVPVSRLLLTSNLSSKVNALRMGMVPVSWLLWA